MRSPATWESFNIATARAAGNSPVAPIPRTCLSCRNSFRGPKEKNLWVSTFPNKPNIFPRRSAKNVARRCPGKISAERSSLSQQEPWISIPGLSHSRTSSSHQRQIGTNRQRICRVTTSFLPNNAAGLAFSQVASKQIMAVLIAESGSFSGRCMKWARNCESR